MKQYINQICRNDEGEARMILEFVKMNPSGNITVIVLTPVSSDLYGEVARVRSGTGRVCSTSFGARGSR